NHAHYQVLIIPSVYVSLAQALGEQVAANVTRWVDQGGVLITLGNASAWAVEAELLNSALERVISEQSTDKHGNNKSVEGLVFESKAQLMHYIAPEQADPYWTSGILEYLDVVQVNWVNVGVQFQL